MKRQLKADYQKLKTLMSRVVRHNGGQCRDDSNRGPGIHTTYELDGKTVGYTWHLSPSDSRVGIKKNIASLRKVLTALGLHEHRDQLMFMMRSVELSLLEWELLDQVDFLEARCSIMQSAA